MPASEKLNAIKKERLKKRIAKNSGVFKYSDLEHKTIEELTSIQKSSLVEFSILLKFKNRKN